jgi:hypothetical protein
VSRTLTPNRSGFETALGALGAPTLIFPIAPNDQTAEAVRPMVVTHGDTHRAVVLSGSNKVTRWSSVIDAATSTPDEDQ